MGNALSLYKKIVLLIAGLLLFNYLAVELVLFNYAGKQMSNRYIQNVEATSDLLGYNINQIFRDASQLVDYLALDLTYNLVNGVSPSNNLADIIRSHDEVLNAYVAYTDGTYDIVPYTEIPEGFDPRLRSWYKDALDTAVVVWSAPYVDITSNQLVISGTKRIEKKGSSAVVGLDITLKELSGMIGDLYLGENGWVGVISEENEFVASNRSVFLGQSLMDINDEVLVNQLPSSGKLTTDQGIYYIQGLQHGNLRLMTFISDEDINGVKSQGQRILTIVSTAILLVGILAALLIARRVTNPLVALKDVMIAAKISGDMKEVEEGNDDEVNTLIKAYNNLAKHINAQQTLITSLAYSDELTGLANRHQFDEQMKEAIISSDQVAMFYMDLDDFKYINDSYGHQVGDQILKRLSEALRVCCGDGALMARLSGDEFGVGIVNYGKDEDLSNYAKKMLQTIRKPIQLHQITFNVTASLGISRYPGDALNYAELMANADIAMYSAKDQAKDRFAIFNESIHQDFLNVMGVETRLNQAINDGKIYPVFQPLVEMKSNRIIGFEALARWTDNDLGPIYPDVFIPIAERNQSIVQLGRHILDESIKFGQEMYERYEEYFEINVNVSVIQLKEERFVDDVLEILTRYNYPPRFLNLEITESVTLESSDQIGAKLGRLRQAAIAISLDDFGTGYSSLGHLTDLYLTHIKIDRGLILKAKESEEVFQLMKGIVNFAHTMGYLVIAEGIEEKEMETMVVEMKADFGQGYMYARPMLKEDILILLEA